MTRWGWLWRHSRKGLLLTDTVEGMGRVITQQFNEYRDYGVWWDRFRHTLPNPEFVEWVEEQRSRAP